MPNSSQLSGTEEIKKDISVDNIPNTEIGVKVTYEEETPVIQRGRRVEEKKKKRKSKRQVSTLREKVISFFSVWFSSESLPLLFFCTLGGTIFRMPNFT